MALTPRGLRLRRAKGSARVSGWTIGLATLAGVMTVAVVAAEVRRVWRRSDAPLPSETDDLGEAVDAVEAVARETAEVAFAGYRETPTRENAAFNLLVSFVASSVLVRSATHLIRARGRLGPFRNVRIRGTHVHHFVPGIVLMVISGSASLLSDNEEHDKWLAIPFGAGAAMTLDESALLLELDDVYWTERGVVSVQVTLGATSILAAVGLAMRLLRRGEREVLESAGSAAVPRTAEAAEVPAQT
jgi:hypothetical protein